MEGLDKVWIPERELVRGFGEGSSSWAVCGRPEVSTRTVGLPFIGIPNTLRLIGNYLYGSHPFIL